MIWMPNECPKLPARINSFLRSLLLCVTDLLRGAGFGLARSDLRLVWFRRATMGSAATASSGFRFGIRMSTSTYGGPMLSFRRDRDPTRRSGSGRGMILEAVFPSVLCLGVQHTATRLFDDELFTSDLSAKRESASLLITFQFSAMPHRGSMISNEQRSDRPVGTVLAMPKQKDDADSWMSGCEPTSR